MTAKFITFEGTEGVGKTTLINNLEKVLTERASILSAHVNRGVARLPKNYAKF